jgi:hypothetical protein
MIVDAGFLSEWKHKGHVYGECMSHADSDFMYIHIPKNASSWTKPNLLDFGWEFYNYHDDKLTKNALVVLRDPVDRWLSGIAEYMTLYHENADVAFMGKPYFDLVFDKVTFDDHTDLQVKFLHGLDTDSCTFFLCDENYRELFAKFIEKNYGANKYSRYDYQHVSENSPTRKKFKQLFKTQLDKNTAYLKKIKEHYAKDYELMNQVRFYNE